MRVTVTGGYPGMRVEFHENDEHVVPAVYVLQTEEDYVQFHDEKVIVLCQGPHRFIADVYTGCGQRRSWRTAPDPNSTREYEI